MKVSGASNLDIITEEAIERIFHYTQGIPRLINILCDTALIYGFADELKEINAKVIEEVIKDKRQGGLFKIPKEAILENSS